MTDRKPQPGDVYDLRVTVVKTVRDDVLAFINLDRPFYCPLKAWHAHATLVSAAPREFKVGDRVRCNWWGSSSDPARIALIKYGHAVLDCKTFLSAPFRLSVLRHADEAEGT